MRRSLILTTTTALAAIALTGLAAPASAAELSDFTLTKDVSVDGGNTWATDGTTIWEQGDPIWRLTLSGAPLDEDVLNPVICDVLPAGLAFWAPALTTSIPGFNNATWEYGNGTSCDSDAGWTTDNSAGNFNAVRVKGSSINRGNFTDPADWSIGISIRVNNISDTRYDTFTNTAKFAYDNGASGWVSSNASSIEFVSQLSTLTLKKSVSLNGGNTWSDTASSTPTIVKGGDSILWRTYFTPASRELEFEDEAPVLCDTLPAPLTLSGPVTAFPESTGTEDWEIEWDAIEYGTDTDCASEQGEDGWSSEWFAGANTARVIYDEIEEIDTPDFAELLIGMNLPVTLPDDLAPGDYSNTATLMSPENTEHIESNASVIRIPAPDAPLANPETPETLPETGGDLSALWLALPLLGAGVLLLVIRRRALKARTQ